MELKVIIYCMCNVVILCFPDEGVEGSVAVNWGLINAVICASG